MRRKALQDFANVCCQMFITSLSNYDRINLVLFGSGVIHIDFLTMHCEYNNFSISPLFYCVNFKSWLESQCDKHQIGMAEIKKAELLIQVDLTLSRKESLGWLTSEMTIACKSCIATSEKEYKSEMSDKQNMGLGQILIDRQY